MKVLNQEEYKEYRKKVPYPEINLISGIMCSCGRMYASTKNEDGYVCVLCDTGLSEDQLKLLYEKPIPQDSIFMNTTLPDPGKPTTAKKYKGWKKFTNENNEPHS